MSNEVYVGSGTQVTMIPESTILLGYPSDISDATITFSDETLKLVPNLYVGCEVTFVTTVTTTRFTIISNTTSTITLDSDLPTSHPDNNTTTITISKFGSPVPAPEITIDAALRQSLLSDNWLGLVNEFTPPNVEVEMKQLNLAVAGTRNFAHQYKGAETVSGGSLDISMNNGSWLYYALGKIDAVTHTATSDEMDSESTVVTPATDSTKFYRAIGSNEYPPTSSDDTLKEIGTGTIAYTFKELNGQDLPSFALDVSYAKGSLSTGSRYVPNQTGDTMYSRIFTGCQVNTMTLNFEESQELKTSLELVTRRAFDAPDSYSPHRTVVGATGVANGTLFNYDASTTTPYMYSDGSITLFGQTYARVKSGSLTINNNFTQQRFIGNTNRQIMNAHIPAQRTYELSLTLLITDTAIWKELREQEEYDSDTGKIKLRFEKSANDFIEIELDDYIIQSVNVPFPSDKGPIEVEATISARKLSDCKYTGKWVIINDD